MNYNDWLVDSTFLENSTFKDTYYLTALCKYIHGYLRYLPVPVVTTWDNVNQRIYFHVGDKKKFVKVDTDISYGDFVTLADRWLRNFFPQYDVELEITRKLTEDEIFELKKQAEINNKKFDLNEVMERMRVELSRDRGIITKAWLTNDEFTFKRNNLDVYIRMSKIPLSIFLKKLREMTNEVRKREYLFHNSVEVRIFNEKSALTSINYKGLKMLNFFIINYEDLKQYEIKPMQDGLYQWGKFCIDFENNRTLEEDCFNFYKGKKKEEEIKNLTESVNVKSMVE